MTEHLKPCPFCGGEAEIIRLDDGMYQVVCRKCDGARNMYFDFPVEAAYDWNSRPIEEELEKENKRLREALEHVVTTDTTVDKYGIWRIDGKTFQTWAADILKGNENV